MTSWARGERGAFQIVGGDTGTDTEVSERLRGHGGTRTLATRDSWTGFGLVSYLTTLKISVTTNIALLALRNVREKINIL